MMLEFNQEWRFVAPKDGKFQNSQIPTAAVNEVFELIGKLSAQGDRQTILEHFKGFFCNAIGTTHIWSSSGGWAETDLGNFMGQAAANAPSFIDALFDAMMTLKTQNEKYYVPGEKELNKLFRTHSIGYQIQDRRLLLREHLAPSVEVEAKTESLDEKSTRLIEASLSKAEQLLAAGDGKQAISEILWLLEIVSTAFRGMATTTGTVAGKYFNQIVKELRAANRGSNLDRILDWATSLHGFLSSPTGGGVRHGLDLTKGLEPTQSESRLYVNLIRSYIGYLLAEHSRLSREGTT